MATSQLEVTRTVTTKTTIPVFNAAAPYAAATGTLTTNSVDATVLDYAGTMKSTDLFGPDNQWAKNRNLWVYESTSTNGSVRRIVGITQYGTGGLSWGIVLDNAFTTPLAAEAIKIVFANLQDYEVINTGAAAGIYDGASLPVAGVIKRQEDSARSRTRIYRDAKVVNGAGTTLLITQDK